jgi:hypothetical protein
MLDNAALKDLLGKNPKPAAQRLAVKKVMERHGLSQRHACRLVGMDRLTLHHRGKRPDDSALRQRLRELAADAAASGIGGWVGCSLVRSCGEPQPPRTLKARNSGAGLRPNASFLRTSRTIIKCRLFFWSWNPYDELRSCALTVASSFDQRTVQVK